MHFLGRIAFCEIDLLVKELTQNLFEHRDPRELLQIFCSLHSIYFLYTWTFRILSRLQWLPLTSWARSAPVETFYPLATKFKIPQTLKTRMNCTKRSKPCLVLSMTKPKGALLASHDLSFETVRTDANDNRMRLAWAVVLSDESQRWFGREAAATNNEGPVQQKGRHR